MWAYKLIWNRLTVGVLFERWSCKFFSQEQDNNGMCNNGISHLDTAIQHHRDMNFFPILYTQTRYLMICQVFQLVQEIHVHQVILSLQMVLSFQQTQCPLFDQQLP